MRPARKGQDEIFWDIVGDLRWRLDDGAGSMWGSDETEFTFGARDRSRLGQRIGLGHLVAFALGAASTAAIFGLRPLFAVVTVVATAAIVVAFRAGG